MTEDHDRTEPRKPRRLLRGAALSVVLMAVCAPWAGAANVQLPQPPLPRPDSPVNVPQVPVEVPELPVEQPPAPELPPVQPDVTVPEVTTLPAPVEELAGGVVGEVGTVVDEAVGTVDDVVGGGGPVDEVVDEVGGVVDGVTGGGPVDEVVDEVGGVVDEVTGGAGDAVDEVVGGGGGGNGGGVVDTVDDVVGGVVDTVDGATDPLPDVVDEVTGPVGEVVDEVTDQVGNNGGAVVDKVGDVVDGVLGGSPLGGDPSAEGPTGASSVGPQLGGGGRSSFVPEEVAGVRTGRKTPVAPAAVDGFAAAFVNGGTDELATAPSTPTTQAPAPSLFERIARSASEVAGKIAFPMLLAFAVGAFVLLQNRIDRKDPKLALAAVDAEEDLLGFE